jgi:hypothetical protein
MRALMRGAAVAALSVLTACVEGGGPATVGGGPINHPVFARQLAGPQTYLAPMPTALVVLTDADEARNRALCDAFARLPTAQAAMQASIVAPNLVLTRWPINTGDVPLERAEDCNYLVLHYDFSRIAALRRQGTLTQGSLAGRGPFLILVLAEHDGLKIAGIDGSGYDAKEFDHFVSDWSEAVSQTQARFTRQPDDPGVVRSALQLVSAIFRAVFGVAAGVIFGVVSAL